MAKVIICPLDWGIGHATRCVPVIRKFLEAGYEVILAADGRPLEFLRTEFPECRYTRFPGISVRYPENGSMVWAIFSQIPKMIRGLLKEKRFLKKIIRDEKPDIIFSDNRYGLWSGSAYCIFMTHQLEIQVPGKIKFGRYLLRKAVYFLISRFDECWIPDFELNWGLAGRLSHPPVLPGNTIYIGALSRFPLSQEHFGSGSRVIYDIMVILSGPEPQRTIFERLIFRELEKSGMRALVVCGKPEETDERTLAGNIRVFSHLETGRMKEFMMSSAIIICRSGYSSIMDLVSLGKRAILVPTPGQTEQEYLAKILFEKKIFFSIQQKNFDLIYALDLSVNYPGIFIKNDYAILEKKIRDLPKRQVL